MGANTSHLCCGRKQSSHPFSPITLSETSLTSSTARSTSPLISSPFDDSGLSNEDPLKLIEGFDKEPLVTLEEALAPFNDEIDQLSSYIKGAKIECHYPSKHNLTRDESAAIYIFTNRWGKGCLYDSLQTAWKSKDPSQMKRWFKFLNLYKSGYNKLPDANEEVWRGKAFDPRLKEQLTLESESLYATMDIFSSSKTSLEQALNDANVKQKILFSLLHVGAKRADEYTAHYNNRLLVFPGSKVAVSTIETSGDDGSVTYHLKGTIPPKTPKKPEVIAKHYECPNKINTCSFFT